MISAGQQVTVCSADPSTFERLLPLVCSGSLPQEEYTQCTDRFASGYFTNLDRVPANYTLLFEKFVEMGTNLVFSYCNFEVMRKMLLAEKQADVCLPITETSIDCYQPIEVTRSISQCMVQALNGEHIDLFDEEGATAEGPQRFPLLGGMYTFPDFMAEVARMLSEETTAGPLYFNYFIGGGEGTVPQTPSVPPEGSPPAEDGVDREGSSDDSPDGPPRGSSDDVDGPSERLGDPWGGV